MLSMEWWRSENKGNAIEWNILEKDWLASLMGKLHSAMFCHGSSLSFLLLFLSSHLYLLSQACGDQKEANNIVIFSVKLWKYFPKYSLR